MSLFVADDMTREQFNEFCLEQISYRSEGKEDNIIYNIKAQVTHWVDVRMWNSDDVQQSIAVEKSCGD